MGAQKTKGGHQKNKEMLKLQTFYGKYDLKKLIDDAFSPV